MANELATYELERLDICLYRVLFAALRHRAIFGGADHISVVGRIPFFFSATFPGAPFCSLNTIVGSAFVTLGRPRAALRASRIRLHAKPHCHWYVMGSPLCTWSKLVSV